MKRCLVGSRKRSLVTLPTLLLSVASRVPVLPALATPADPEVSAEVPLYQTVRRLPEAALVDLTKHLPPVPFFTRTGVAGAQGQQPQLPLLDLLGRWCPSR